MTAEVLGSELTYSNTSNTECQASFSILRISPPVFQRPKQTCEYYYRHVDYSERLTLPFPIANEEGIELIRGLHPTISQPKSSSQRGSSDDD